MALPGRIDRRAVNQSAAALQKTLRGMPACGRNSRAVQNRLRGSVLTPACQCRQSQSPILQVTELVVSCALPPIEQVLATWMTVPR